MLLCCYRFVRCYCLLFCLLALARNFVFGDEVYVYIRVWLKLQYDNITTSNRKGEREKDRVDIAIATQNRKIWLTTRQCLPPLVSFQIQNYTNDGVDDQKKNAAAAPKKTRHTGKKRVQRNRKQGTLDKIYLGKKAQHTKRCRKDLIVSWEKLKKKNTNTNALI